MRIRGTVEQTTKEHENSLLSEFEMLSIVYLE